MMAQVVGYRRSGLSYLVYHISSNTTHKAHLHCRHLGRESVNELALPLHFFILLLLKWISRCILEKENRKCSKDRTQLKAGIEDKQNTDVCIKLEKKESMYWQLLISHHWLAVGTQSVIQQTCRWSKHWIGKSGEDSNQPHYQEMSLQTSYSPEATLAAMIDGNQCALFYSAGTCPSHPCALSIIIFTAEFTGGQGREGLWRASDHPLQARPGHGSSSLTSNPMGRGSSEWQRVRVLFYPLDARISPKPSQKNPIYFLSPWSMDPASHSPWQKRLILK